MAFGKNLQDLLNRKNMTISDAARITGVPYTTLHSIIKRDSINVAVDVAVKISKGFGLTIDEIQGWANGQYIPSNEFEAIALVVQEGRELLMDISLLCEEDKEQVKSLIRYLARRG